LETAEALKRALAIDLVVAWRIMLMMKVGRAHPDMPCTILLEAHERFRKLLGGGKYKVVEPVLPMDLMGVYVLLPERN